MDFRNWDYKYTLKKFDLEIKRLGKLELKIVIVNQIGRDFKTKAGRTTITSH
jgi:hypothetical protein